MLRYLEKLSYLVGVPALCLGLGFAVYRSRLEFQQQRAQRLQEY